VPNVLVLLPAVFFVVCTLPAADESMAGFEYGGIFKLFSIIFFSIFVLVFIFSGLFGEAFNQVFAIPIATFLFAMSFFVHSVMLMRMTRHDEAVFKQMRFKIMNALSLIGVIIIIVFFSTDVFLAFVRSAIEFGWRHLLLPAIQFALWVITAILGVLSALFSFIIRILGIEGDFDSPPIEMLPPPEEIPEYLGSDSYSSPWAFIIVIVLAASALIMFALFTRRASTAALRDDGVLEERFMLDDDAGKGGRLFKRRRENQVREVYRKFLVFIKKQEVHLPLYFTSSDVEGSVVRRFEVEKSSDLRGEYIRVRYGESKYTKDDVSRIRGLYREVKAEIERN